MAKSLKMNCTDRQPRISQMNVVFRPVREMGKYDMSIVDCAGIHSRRARGSRLDTAAGHHSRDVGSSAQGLE